MSSGYYLYKRKHTLVSNMILAVATKQNVFTFSCSNPTEHVHTKCF